MDHAEARAVFVRFVAGSPVTKDDEERALAHGATCEACAEEFGPGPTGGPVDTTALFDAVLAAALHSPEAIVRARAAEQLGATGRASTAALAVLAEAAERDPEERVRVAARRALDGMSGAGGPVPGGPAPA